MGSGGAHRTAVDCDRLVADMWPTSRGDRGSGAEIEVGDLPVVAPTAQLSQVFQNLIGNAIKFTEDESPRVPCGPSAAGEYRFAVSDNGIGIPAGEEERIFQVFKRLHARDDYDGTGMGLAICRRAIERHGGTIWVESRPGGGSVFCFTVADPDDV